MEFTLLEVVIPLGSIIGYVASAALAIMSYLVKKYLDRIDIRLEDLEDSDEKAKLALEKALLDSNTNISIERERSRAEMLIIDSRITNLHLNILEKLDEIKYKFQEARR